jgi:hypothetical protein
MFFLLVVAKKNDQSEAAQVSIFTIAPLGHSQVR